MMFTTNYSYTKSDHLILNSYISVIEALAGLIGQHCEIVLHSLEDLDHSAIYIVNGHHTARQIGSPLTDFALQTLHSLRKEEHYHSQPYFTRSKGETLMKSMTIPIYNQQRVIGLLCINLNLDVPMSQFLQNFIPNNEQSIQPSKINFASSVEDLVAQTVEQTIMEIVENHDIANHNKNRQIVFHLYEKGIFNIRDAINQVAERLNISKHTVYFYIRQIKQEDNEK